MKKKALNLLPYLGKELSLSDSVVGIKLETFGYEN